MTHRGNRMLPEGVYWEPSTKCGLVHIVIDSSSVNGGQIGWGCPHCNLMRAEEAEKKLKQLLEKCEAMQEVVNCASIFHGQDDDEEQDSDDDHEARINLYFAMQRYRAALSASYCADPYCNLEEGHSGDHDDTPRPALSASDAGQQP